MVDDWESAAAEDATAASPALQATLQALEWQRLCDDIASFAKTSLGAAVLLRDSYPPQGSREAAAAGTATLPTTQPCRYSSSHRTRA